MRLLFLSIALAIGILMDFVLKNCLSGYPRFPTAMLLIAAACIALLVAFDDPLIIAKGLLFASMAVLVSFYDGLTHNIPNLLLLPFAAIGLINFNPAMAFTGLLAAFLPFLLVFMLTKGGIGGGDVKLMAAIGFVLGPIPTVSGALLGLTAFLPYGLVCRLHKHKSISYAMAPWLSSGCFFAYLFSLIWR